MEIRTLLFSIIVGLIFIYLIEKRRQILWKKIHEQLLEEKDTELQGKEEIIQQKQGNIEEIKKEKASIEAKYLKKLKAAEVKKKNLKKYRKKKKETRTVKEQMEDIIGKGDKWLPHSCQEYKSSKMGKPKGAKGGGRKRPEKIHYTQDLYPHACPGCETSLINEKAYLVYDKVLTELFREKDEVDCYESLKLRNIKQHVHRRKCPQCKKWVYPDQGLFANCRFGIGFVAYVISKRIRITITYEDIIHDMRDMFGLEFFLSVPTIINWFYKFEAQIRDVYDQLEELVKQEDFLHIDETGLPMMGENWWLWVVCTANLVLYRQSHTRGHTAIEDIIKEFEGTIIADFFSAYLKFNDNEHQKCLAHLLSTIIELIVKLQKENERIERKLKDHTESLKLEKEQVLIEEGKMEKKRGRKPKINKLKSEQISLLKSKHISNQKTLTQATDLGALFRAPFIDSCFSWKKDLKERISKKDAEDILIGIVESIKNEGVADEELNRILKRCVKYKETLFTYLQWEGMPPDNNRAERDLRNFAKKRRNSKDFKSIEVIKHLIEYLALYMTCKLNGRDFNILLKDILSDTSVDLSEFLFGI